MSYGKARLLCHLLSPVFAECRPPQVEVRDNGICELDLFVGRTSNQDVERRLCHRCVPSASSSPPPRSAHFLFAPSRLRRAIERPIEVGVTGKGIDAVTTELCVTAPMDAGGYARPRVLLGALFLLQRRSVIMVSVARSWYLRCDKCASPFGNHGVQGTCQMPQQNSLYPCSYASHIAGRHPYSAHPWQAASRSAPLPAHRRYWAANRRPCPPRPRREAGVCLGFSHAPLRLTRSGGQVRGGLLG